MVTSLESSAAASAADVQPVVFIVDADPRSRQELATWIKSTDRSHEAYASWEELVENADISRPGCVVIDIGSQGSQGIEAVERAIEAGAQQPIIVRAMDPDISIAVRAMRTGASNFLDKLMPREELHQAIENAIARDLQRRRQRQQQADLVVRFAHLDAGQRQVLDKLLEGKPNKTIAAELAISLRTVKIRCARLMKKTRSQSLAELVGMALKLKEAARVGTPRVVPTPGAPW